MNGPDRIGSYPIERELGRGGMGIVYLGRDTKLGRAVAIKVLPDAFALDPERLSRFEREAKLLASLNHPNIAGIYGLEEADGRRFLALEFVEGPTLADRLARGALPLDECLEVARQIAAALEAAHESGVIHRDLKPGNVKLTPAGDVKVLDFGLAKGAGTAESSPDLSQSPTLAYAPTGVGVILGTAAYMSPEQARGKTVDRRTDIWSFGCVLYEMLTGRQLFSGETVSDTIAKILEREPDWSAIPATVPERIRELLHRCLEKDARKRLRDVGDARIELEEAVAARSSKGRRAAAEVEAVRGARARAPVMAYAVAVTALAVAAVAVLWPLLRSDRGPAVRLSVSEPEGASLNGDAVDCALSPDGRSLVFVASDSSGTVQLWLRPLETLGGRPIPGTDNASRPFWSPDSRWVGFFADGKLKKARLGGGVEVVCDAPNARGGTWSSKGTIVFAPAGEGPLSAVSATGGEPRQVTTLDSTKHETAHRFPCFLPDQRHFLYVVLPGGARGFKVMAASVDGGAPRRIMDSDSAPVYAEPGYLVFLRDRNLVAQRFDAGAMRLEGEPLVLPDTPAGSQNTGLRAATVSTNGALAYMNGAVTNSRLVWFDRSGRMLGTVPVPAAQYQLPVLSPDDRTVAVSRFTSANEADIWLVDLARGVSTRFTYGPRQNVSGFWSPDGSRISFESNRDGPYDIYVKATSGALPEQALVQGRSQFKHPTSWTPDGRTLLFYQMDPGTGFDIWSTPTDGSGAPTPYLQTPFHDQFPFVSPDGRWLAYTSDESGRPELYVQSFPTPGHKYQVTTGGCLLGGWRADGKEVILLGLEGQNIFSADVLESGTTFRTSTPRLLFRAPPNVAGFSVTHDGQRFLMPIPEGKTAAASITVVLNWRAALAAHPDDRR
jgi:Tol biopolymer transport system component/predicted Ser/Thr protein kinase